MTHLTLIAAVLGAALSTAGQTEQGKGFEQEPLTPSACIPDGGADSLCAYVVAPPNGTVTATAEENDTFSNDPLGEPTIMNAGGNVYVVCIQITNDSGSLSGPNGVPQTGTGEGQCIEVDLNVTVGTPASVGGSIPSGAGLTVEYQGRNTTTHSQSFCAC